MVEKISPVILQVANMEASVCFYQDVLGLEIIYGGEGSYFTSLRTKDGATILNLEHGNAGIQWGRLIFHVSDVDRFWAYLIEKAFIQTAHTMARGANVIFIWPILMAMRFHLLVRSSLGGFLEKPSASHPAPENPVHVLFQKSNPGLHRKQQVKTSMRVRPYHNARKSAPRSSGEFPVSL